MTEDLITRPHLEPHAAEPAKTPTLILKTGPGDERHVAAPHGATVLTIIQIIAAEQGCAVEELIIIRDGEALPLDLHLVLDADYPRHRRHHVHRKAEVDVEVFYNADAKHHAFPRRTTIEQVLAWAIKAFGIDPVMATEFELALHDHKDELAGDEHLGHLVGHHTHLGVDLVRGAFVNGASVKGAIE